MIRISLLTLLLTPMVLLFAWGDTLALYVGQSPEGAQARHYPAPRPEPGPSAVSVLDTRQIVPGTGLPPEAKVMTANNNLDALRHSDGRVYLAWRSAPDHFAGPETVIQVISSADERNWRFEHRFALGTDLREPRLLSRGDSLFLYATRLGKNRLDFEPGGVLGTEKRPDGSWSALRSLELPGAVAWRTRNLGGRAYMLAYRGGENIYRFNGRPLHVDLLTSDDGRAWRPVDPKRRAVYVGGGSEADFVADPAGGFVGVIRNEAGDKGGWGSLICRAPQGRPADWKCRHDPRKFDSPFMFTHGSEVYLLGRRNISPDGAYQLDWRNPLLGSIRNQLNYVTRAKRCALWHYDRKRDDLRFVLDLPSRGDTCFPAGFEGEQPGEFTVYDYSSPIEGADLPWSVGQRGPTRIYRHTLRFSPPAS